jgi:hypothetical protein
MNRKTYSPYKIKAAEVNRFRGVMNLGNEAALEKAYVGKTNNMPSFKIAQIDSREGQVKEASLNGVFS